MAYICGVEQRLLSLIALSKIPLVGPVTGRNLIAYCGSPEKVFQMPVSKLAKIPQIGPVIAQYIRTSNVRDEAEAELRRHLDAGYRAIDYLDPAYPGRLKHFDESPLVIYCQGSPDFAPARTLGIIGTRKPTPQGKIFTEEFVCALQPFGLTIVSGMAHGIDSFAHEYALREGIPTIGVLGHGLKTIYPAIHRALARQMTGANGLITEFQWDTKPDKENFPMRNRIIAALSDALIVVESKEKGGSMITAEFANRYNKDVFARPGRPCDPYSKGCNLLIKSNKAHLAESADDLIRIMQWEPVSAGNKMSRQTVLPLDLSENERQLMEVIASQPESQVDAIGYRMEMPPSQLSPLLLDLEFKGLIHQLPGKRYVLAKSADLH